MSVNAKRLIGFLLVTLTLFVGSTFNSGTPVWLAAVLAILIVLAKHRRYGEQPDVSESRLPRALRWILMSMVILLIISLTSVWRIGSQLGESINPIYVGTDIIAHVAMFVALLLWAMRPSQGHILMLPLGLVVVLLCVAAGGTSLSLPAQMTVSLAACVGFTIASQVILGTARGTRGAIFDRDPQKEGKAAWMGPLLSMLTLSILMMATSAIANGTSVVLPRIQQRLQEQLQVTFDPVADRTSIGGTGYVTGSKLGEIRRHMIGSPKEIALRIHAEVTPGYLRGSVFDFYRRRRWLSVGDNAGTTSLMRDRFVAANSKGTTELQSAPSQPLFRFSLIEAEPRGGRADTETINLEIYNDPMKGKLVFLPLTTRWLEAYSQEIIVTRNSVVRYGVDVQKPYVAGVSASPLKEGLAAERRAVLLEVPDRVSEQTQGLAKQLCSDKTTARSKAEAISDYFQSEFTYSLTLPAVPRGVDPINQFLATKHPAHCEYFASATVMTLRSAGVPARYVTGYVADEFDVANDMWVARNADAHAWAEAYDDGAGEWFAVESTPGRTYMTVQPEEELSLEDGFFDVFGGSADDDNDGLISRAVGWILSIRATAPLLLLFRLAQIPLFCVLVYVLWTRYLRPAKENDSIDMQSQRMLRRADRRVRKHALVRGRGETLYQFADRVAEHGSDRTVPIREDARHMLEDLSTWYRKYADARYQGQLPEPFVF